MTKFVFINKTSYSICIFLVLLVYINGYSQVLPGVYNDTIEENGVKKIYQVKLNNDYFIYNVYERDPAKFTKTLGGFAKIEKSISGNSLVALLEFNSEYAKDSIRQLSIPIKMIGENIHLNWLKELTLKPIKTNAQDLDGEWLFATRGPDTGQERRGEENTRKTLKFLKDGTFQWIAYDTDSFRFSGAGGGSYTAKDGIYTEHIEFFSKDDTRVGAQLKFNYELHGNDWHHTGNNSKGEPMYEIWSKRQITKE
tara:strand:+ start:88166 stop:88924 length:759 start_codon:yes stop_codon:yes gene_type:complete